MTAERSDVTCDLLVIGGGVNGCGIARDAAGRGLRVVICEKDDLAQATSSASTKLFHGGLRYLEFLEVRLVRESLIERERLLRAMPHISWPLRFVLPLHPDMRFESSTPVSRMMGRAMPWMKGRRPDWLIRLGLGLYDNLGGREILPGTRTVDLTTDPAGRPLKPRFRRAFEYSDCWVEDSRLVVLNAKDAEARGATVLTRTRVVAAHVENGHWLAETDGPGGAGTIRARAVVNASGPWAGEVLSRALGLQSRDRIRLVRGSHIVTRKLFDHDRCYFFQGSDGRIIFAIPYETDYTLIGTTDVEHPDPSVPPVCTPEEQEYLCAFASEYFAKPVTRDDIVWTYSGVRPLYDEGAQSATAATRDYTLKLDAAPGAPVLHVFGGKITTYRRLAEAALEKIGPVLGNTGRPWTAGVPLPGGDFAVDGVGRLVAELRGAHPFLTDRWALRLVRAYGTEARDVLGGAKAAADLGKDFGATLTEAEVRWLMTREYARTADDVLWRRSKLGLRLDAARAEHLDQWMRAAQAGDGQRQDATRPAVSGARG
ncbi:glycerol-3-phosphate dehydrogenase [Rubellimicrobium rubrum]|uniref:Glycerol-3-phosphate dehydrogenase n=1 Tax=Rubellimicrobium rubrum TaxID=2585369 RepID=A0A5C4N386_9RHOB|nr:glycerol-3-phosphate dehydrogenase [Rubellimicrobium rubrum]TNC51952.1 glycerol-3-phosphate dehydrogenase [Rubellimicrobium rubrum]